MPREIKLKAHRGDISQRFVRPIPLLEQKFGKKDKLIGTVVKMEFDGEYTIATVELEENVEFPLTADLRKIFWD